MLLSSEMMQNKNTVIPLSYCEDKQPTSPHLPYINAKHILQLFGLDIGLGPSRTLRPNAQSATNTVGARSFLIISSLPPRVV